MAQHGNLSRPRQWAERAWERVAFVAHALLPDHLSTALIGERLKECGRGWPGPGEEPGYVRWFSHPVVPPLGTARRPIWVDFYIVPVLAPAFLAAARDGRAFQWAQAVALDAIAEAQADGVGLTIGWGALTKVATNHGQAFVERHPEVAWGRVSSTHGDAGTAALVLATMRQAGFTRGFRAAVIGANGAIGDAVARGLTFLQPGSILLVGKADRQGKFAPNRERLEELRGRAAVLVPAGQATEVAIHQDKSRACHEHDSDVVIVATTGMELAPSEIPAGALVIDMTTPAACHADPAWRDQLVLTSGCGDFLPAVVPRGFAEIGGRRRYDVGAGGLRVIWGCTGETIARAVFGWRGHLVGPAIPMEAVEWCSHHFSLLGFAPQPPLSFNRPLSWQAVRTYVRTVADLKRASRANAASFACIG